LWYELWNQRKESNFVNVKIVVPELSDRNRFMLDTNNYYYGDTVCGFYLKKNIDIDIKYILGILNSKFIEWYYKRTTVPKANNYFIYKTMFLKTIPMRKIDFHNDEELRTHNVVVSLVNSILILNDKIKNSTGNLKEQIQNQANQACREIDEIVYKLYSLTDEEIGIVEDYTKSNA
jgi:hypothetical protein